jgi:hypothetical protein
MWTNASLSRRNINLAVLAACAALTACGGGQDSNRNPIQSPTPPPPPPTLGGTVSGLSGSMALRLNGSETLNVASSGPFTFATLQSVGVNWNAEIQRAPQAQNCAISNGSGTGSTSPVTNIAVNCQFRSWRAAETFGAEPGQWQQRPLVAYDDNGLAVILSKRLDTNYVFIGRLQAAERAANGTWTPIGSSYLDNTVGDESSFVYGYDIAANGNGYAVATWAQCINESCRIQVTRRTGPGSWLPPLDIDVDSPNQASTSSSPQVSVAPDGSAFIVWQSHDTAQGRSAIFASRYMSATGWSAPVRIDSNAGPSREPQVATDANGNAAVVWTQGDSGSENTWGASYRASTGWTAAVSLDGGYSGSVGYHRVAMNDSGAAFAAWQRFDNATTRGTGVVSSFTPAAGWSTSPTVLIAESADWVLEPSIAINDAGAAFAVYPVYRPSAGRNYSFAVRYTPSSGWDAPFEVHDDASRATVGIDSDGNGTVVMEGNSTSLLARRYYAVGTATGWQPLESDIDGSATGRAGDAVLALAPDGSAMVVFSLRSDTAPNLRTPQAVRLE